ncbi:MAG TPA: cytochrome P450 [Methylibium sp.]|nr:cytochrome P450 [Methylibium sp.]
MSAVPDTPRRPLARPIGADFARDPYPTYHAWREAGPMLWSADFFGGAWIVTRHAEVALTLRDARLSARRTGGWVMRSRVDRRELAGFQRLFARALLFLDAPEHDRLHELLYASFRPAALQGLKPSIERGIDALLDAVGPGGFDFMEALARPLPALVIAELLGVPEVDHVRFARWSEALSAFIGALQPTPEQARAAQAALLAMAEAFEALLAKRGSGAGHTLIDQLLRAEAEGRVRSRTELLAQCVMLLFAGYETTRNLLGNGLQALLAHPAQWRRLQAEPQLAGAAVRELLRYESPVQYTGRRATTDVLLHGQWVRRGELVIALIGAANRDPRQHERPDVLDIGRAPRPSLAFGAGAHACLGAALTLIEGEALLRRLIERRVDWRLAEAPPRWGGSALYRGLAALPLA